MLVIPPDELSESALLGVIDAFVLREGTDYGHRHISLQEKRDHVRSLLDKGKAQIVYDPQMVSVDIRLV